MAIVGGYLLYHLYEVKKAVYALTTKVYSIGLNSQSTGLLNTSLQVVLNVYNPSNVALVFRQFIGSVYYNGVVIADFNVSQGSQNIEIYPESVTQVPLTANIQNINLLSQLPELLRGQIKQNIENMVIQGIIIINGFQMPVNLPVSSL